MIIDFEYQPVLEDYKKNGDMKLGSILKILENSGNKHSDKAGDAILEGTNNGKAWILTDWLIDIIAYPKYGDKILAEGLFNETPNTASAAVSVPVSIKAAQ